MPRISRRHRKPCALVQSALVSALRRREPNERYDRFSMFPSFFGPPISFGGKSSPDVLAVRESAARPVRRSRRCHEVLVGRAFPQVNAACRPHRHCKKRGRDESLVRLFKIVARAVSLKPMQHNVRQSIPALQSTANIPPIPRRTVVSRSWVQQSPCAWRLERLQLL
jgi:hypothetical protein